MDYEMEYIVYGEYDDIILDIEFSYKGEEFAIEKVTVKETGAEYEDYDEDDVMAKMIEHAGDVADDARTEALISRWETNQESRYL